jgi:Lsr2
MAPRSTPARLEEITMAQKVQVILVDDIDGGTADETVSFSLDGVAYEIDLSDSNAAKLREVFAPYVGTARRVGGRAAAGRPRTRRARSGDSHTEEIREWAKANGHQVSERGRIAANVVQAYEKAHG